MEPLNLAIRTLFSEFLEAVFHRQSIETDLQHHGTYISKTVKGKKYWYLQHYENGQTVQKYFKPSTQENDTLVLTKRADQKQQRKLLQQLIRSEIKMSVMLKRAGIPSLDSKTASLMTALSGPFLTKGAILIGSHAFAAYCGILGTPFESTLLKTQDIDIAFDKEIQVIGNPITLLDALKGADPSTREVPGLSHKYPPNTFMTSSGVRVDIVAPLVGKPKGGVRIKGLVGVAAEPLRFLDFLIDGPIRAVMIGPKGGIPVYIPDPVRFALHKLIVSQYRPTSEAAKRAKDLAQAAQLIEVCALERTADLTVTYQEITKRGPQWKKAVQSALAQLPAHIHLKELLTRPPT